MSTLRDTIGRAMLRRFEYAYVNFDENYNPDVVWDAADEVVAALVQELTGQEATVLRDGQRIGSLGIRLGVERLV